MITKYSFRMASIWLLTLVSVIKCCVIVKPLTYWTLFTDRVLNTIVCVIWICSIVMTISWLLGPTDPWPVPRYDITITTEPHVRYSERHS